MATENLGANENKKAGEGAKRPRPADGKTPVKKKKIIIVTGRRKKAETRRPDRRRKKRRRDRTSENRS